MELGEQGVERGGGSRVNMSALQSCCKKTGQRSIRSASCKAIQCSGEVHMVNYDNYNQFFTIFAAVMGFKYHNVCQKDKMMFLCFLLTSAFMTGFCS